MYTQPDTDDELPSYRLDRTYEGSKRESPERTRLRSTPLALTLLCTTPSRRRLIEWALTHYQNDEHDVYDQRAIKQQTGMTRNVIKPNANVLAAAGVLERNDEYKYPRWRVPEATDSEGNQTVISQLDSFLAHLSDRAGRSERYASFELFDGGTPLTLIEWVVGRFEAAESDWYSKARIRRETGMTRQAVMDHLPPLVEYGLMVENTENANPRYGVSFTEGSAIDDILGFSSYLVSKLDHDALDGEIDAYE